MLSGCGCWIFDGGPAGERIRAGTGYEDVQDPADMARRRVEMHGLQIGRATDHLARAAARLFDQDGQRPADLRVLEGGLLLGQERLQAGETVGADLVRHLLRAGRRRAWTGRVLEGIGVRVA